MKPIEISTSLFVTIAVEDKDHCHADCEYNEFTDGCRLFKEKIVYVYDAHTLKYCRCQDCKTAFADVEAHYLAIAQNKRG